MGRTTIADLEREIARLRALVAEPREPSEASQHFKARDLPCTAKKPCTKTFRTTKGRDWHVANVKH